MKQRKEFLLDPSVIEYLEKVKSENDSSSLAAALTKVIRDHEHRNDVPATKVLVDALSKGVAEELKDTLTRIRLGTNNADRNSDIILMLLNTLLSYSSYKSLIVKDTPQLVEARQVMKDRIASYKQRKDNRPASSQENEINADTLDEETLL